MYKCACYVRLWKTYLQNRLLFKYSIPIVNSKFNQLICFSMRVLLTCCIWLCLIWQSLTLNNSVLDEGRSPCNEVISPVTLTLSMICINLLLTLIKEITTSRIAYNYTHIHIFTNCSCNCLVVHLYCTILYCHPLYLLVKFSCLVCLYRSLVQVLCVFFLCPVLCPCNQFHL